MCAYLTPDMHTCRTEWAFCSAEYATHWNGALVLQDASRSAFAEEATCNVGLRMISYLAHFCDIKVSVKKPI